MLIMFLLFFFNDTATTEIYTLSLHDALPISRPAAQGHAHGDHALRPRHGHSPAWRPAAAQPGGAAVAAPGAQRAVRRRARGLAAHAGHAPPVVRTFRLGRLLGTGGGLQDRKSVV